MADFSRWVSSRFLFNQFWFFYNNIFISSKFAAAHHHQSWLPSPLTVTPPFSAWTTVARCTCVFQESHKAEKNWGSWSGGPSEFGFRGYDPLILALNFEKSEVGNIVARKRIGFLNSSVSGGGEIRGFLSKVYPGSFHSLFYFYEFFMFIISICFFFWRLSIHAITNAELRGPFLTVTIVE